MKLIILYVLFIILYVIGEVKCIVKVFQCNWEPKYKAEAIYIVGAITTLGGIIGWFNIKDELPSPNKP